MIHPDDPLEVLVVDDDPLATELLMRTLRTRNCQVRSATSGEEALEILNRKGPPLVITDWVMPGIDGLELCRRIRDSECLGFTYVIMLTANTRKDQLATAFAAGADDYITKPFDVREVLSRLKAAERIIRLEAAYRQNAIQLHKVNAMLAVKNNQLRRVMGKLRRSRTQARQVRTQASDASRFKGEFLARMSHEIRTPMTAILGFADSLADAGASEADHHDAIRTIRRSGEHLLSVLNDILDLSKIEAGKMQVESLPCNPVAIVERTAAMFRPRAKDKGLELTTEYPDPLPESIRSDPTRLQQILANLLSNAIKFTERGAVRIVARFLPAEQGNAVPEAVPSRPQIQFDVIDSGIGLTAGQVQRLFEPFAQADSSTARRFGGSGLGLSISRTIAQLLGGSITVQSEPQRGSMFRVRIATGPLGDVRLVTPAAPAQNQPVASAEAHAAPVAPLDADVLLAEDGPDNQRLIAYVLQRAGALVTSVDDGAKAVEAVRAATTRGRKFDVVLMDMQMPVMDGYVATQRLRDQGFTGPIVALTAHAMADDRDKCLAAGCDDYMSKPIDIRCLIETVRRQAQRARGPANT